MTRSWEENYKNEFEIINYSRIYEEGSMECLRKSFFYAESVCTGTEVNINIDAQKDLERLCKEVANDGVSLIMKHKESGKIIGVCFNKIQELAHSDERPYFETFRETCHSESSKALMQFMIDVDSKIDVFETYKINCLLEIMFLAILPDYGKNGIGRKLVENSIRLAKCMKDGENFAELSPVYSASRPQAISAILTSMFSQKIGSYLGFETLTEVLFTDFVFNGKTFAERIGSLHTSSLLVVKKL